MVEVLGDEIKQQLEALKTEVATGDVSKMLPQLELASKWYFSLSDVQHEDRLTQWCECSGAREASK